MDTITHSKLVRDDLINQRDAEQKRLNVLKKRLNFLEKLKLDDFKTVNPYRQYETYDEYTETVKENTLASVESEVAYLEERVRMMSNGVESATQHIEEMQNEPGNDKSDSK